MSLLLVWPRSCVSDFKVGAPGRVRVLATEHHPRPPQSCLGTVKLAGIESENNSLF